MAKGSPDPQHELVITAISRCLRLVYPEIELTQGRLIPDLNLKPDIYVVHPDGRRWAYEVVNKNAGIAKIEENHQTYAQAGVRDYWILWEARGPDKPLDDSILAQSMWITDEASEGPKRYKLTDLQRALASLGDGSLYVFVINKALQATIENLALRLGIIGLAIYHFSLEELQEEHVEGDWDFVPLPGVDFGSVGEPQVRQEVFAIPTFLQPQAEIPSDRPVFAREVFGEVDQLLASPETLIAMLQQSEQEVQAEHGGLESIQTPEFTAALERFLRVKSEIEAHPEQEEENTIRLVRGIEDLIAAMPEPLQSRYRGILPVSAETLRRIFEIRRWLEEDEHVQKLLEEV